MTLGIVNIGSSGDTRESSAETQPISLSKLCKVEFNELLLRMLSPLSHAGENKGQPPHRFRWSEAARPSNNWARSMQFKLLVQLPKLSLLILNCKIRDLPCIYLIPYFSIICFIYPVRFNCHFTAVPMKSG